MQGHHHVGGRREAPLPGLLHVDILVVQVHRQRLAAAGAALQYRPADEHKTHAGHALQALATGRNQGIESGLARIDLQRGERAHGIHDQPAVKLGADIGHRLQGVEYAGTGFTVDQHHMGDGGVFLQSLRQCLGVDRAGLVKAHGAAAPPHQAGDAGGSLAISAVVQHQHMAVMRHQGGDGGFHAEGAAALQGHHHMAVLAMDDGQQAAPHTGCHGNKVGVPRAPVLEHGQLGAQGCGQGPRGQQYAVSIHGGFLQRASQPRQKFYWTSPLQACQLFFVNC